MSNINAMRPNVWRATRIHNRLIAFVLRARENFKTNKKWSEVEDKDSFWKRRVLYLRHLPVTWSLTTAIASFDNQCECTIQFERNTEHRKMKTLERH